MTSALAPGAIGLVSKVPPRSVAVWGRWPVLDQVTVVPASTVSRRGEKSKSMILASPPSWAAAAAGAAAAGAATRTRPVRASRGSRRTEGAHVGYLAVT